jgi:hypothetical protein
LKTSNASAGYQSKVDGCYTMDCDTSIHFDASVHDSLYITCNRLEFKNVGIYTENSTTLKDFGTTNTGAGNRFILTTSNIQENFLNHNGNAVTYYYDPQYATVFSGPVMNVSTSQATNDRACPTILTETCQLWPDVGVQEKIKDAISSFNVYPNPSNGMFYLTSGNTSPEAELIVYDLMGRIVLSRKVNFLKEKTITFELKDKGLYFATLRSPGGQGTKKIIVE